MFSRRRPSTSSPARTRPPASAPAPGPAGVVINLNAVSFVSESETASKSDYISDPKSESEPELFVAHLLWFLKLLQLCLASLFVFFVVVLLFACWVIYLSLVSLPHWQTTRQINICAVNYIWFRYFNASGTWDLLRRLCCPAPQCWPYNSRSNNTKLTIATSHLLYSAPSTVPALWQLMRNKMWSGYYH